MKFRSLLISLAIVGSAAPAAAQVNNDPYIGEVMLTAFNYCPSGWTVAAGQLLSIDQYPALYSIYGNTYGGNGRTDFGLPDLRGRAPVHTGQAEPNGTKYILGLREGYETRALNFFQMPAHSHGDLSHTHVVGVSSEPPNTNDPDGALLSEWQTRANVYSSGATADGNMALGSVTYEEGSFTDFAGEGEYFSVVQPVLPMNYCIAVEGTYPPRPR